MSFFLCYPSVDLSCNYPFYVLFFSLFYMSCFLFCVFVICIVSPYVRGKFNKKVTNRDLKEINGDNDIQTVFIFQCNLQTNLNTCPTFH